MNIHMTIFGGTGDLCSRKLMPALYNLYIREELSDSSSIIAIGRRDYTDEQYIDLIKPWVHQFARLGRDLSKFDSFAKLIHYYRMDFTDPSSYKDLEALEQHCCASSVHLVYLAVAPQYFRTIAENYAKLSTATDSRILLEKPFGETLEDARLLNTSLEQSFGSDHIFRIDHYLGKEMVRSMLDIRRTNPIFANAWNKDFIQAVEISAMEEVGVETRGGYYDQAGAVKDMVQNHLMQIMTILALDQPDQPSIREQQIEIMHSLRKVDPKEIQNQMVLGQYEGYRNEQKVDPKSTTETFAALRLYLDHPRWQGVPFLLRTGKKCKERFSEAAILFKPANEHTAPDVLRIRIQPTEEIHLEFNVKNPGDQAGLQSVQLSFCQSCNDIFHQNTPEAYERMLLACANNDSSWFTSFEAIETSWSYIQQLKDAYRSSNLPVYPYPQNENGPKEADRLLEPFSSH